MPSNTSEQRLRDRLRLDQGLTVFFTGLPGAGKSTTANVLLAWLEKRDRSVTLLDGDVLRRNVSADLGFTREDRNVNVRRVAAIAAEITKAGGVALCAVIAPYDSARKEARAMIAAVGGFVLVHVATPINVCERRDQKGLYAKARSGLLERFTGISDPYEPPLDADVVIDTTTVMPDAAVSQVIEYLTLNGYLSSLAME